jgi:hypothetical protein
LRSHLITKFGLTGNMPLRLCRPSQFWLTRYLRRPLFCNSTKAMCVGVGIACSVVAELKLSSLPWARSVQAPSGPRKSGIPADVETPAPVKAMKCLPFLIWLASSVAIRSTTSGGSKRSTLAILGAVRSMTASNFRYTIFLTGRRCMLSRQYFSTVDLFSNLFICVTVDGIRSEFKLKTITMLSEFSILVSGTLPLT